MTLHQRIVERLKMPVSLYAPESMVEFRPDARENHISPHGGRLCGHAMGSNARPSVVIDNGQRWNISPHLLSLKDIQTETVVDNRLQKISIPLRIPSASPWCVDYTLKAAFIFEYVGFMERLHHAVILNYTSS